MKEWQIGKKILSTEGDMMVQSFLSVNHQLKDGGFRIWFSHYSHEAKQYGFGYVDTDAALNIRQKTIMQISSEPQKEGLHIIGVPAHWQLIQPVHVPLDNHCERIYFWAHAEEGICRFFAADSTDGINFYVKDKRRPCLYHPNDRAISIDSLKHQQLTAYCGNGHRNPDPDEPEATVDMLMNDATNVYRLEDGTFELYSAEVTNRIVSPGKQKPDDSLLRIIQRRTSADGLIWSKPERVVIPDDNDPYDLQFYSLAVTHTPEGRIGILGHYRSDPGTMDAEFCYSQDGIHWERERCPGFPRAKGIAGIYCPHSMLRVEDKYVMFYTGYNFNHHGQLDPDAAKETCDSWIGCAEIPVEKL